MVNGVFNVIAALNTCIAEKLFFSLAPFFGRVASTPQPYKPCPLPFARALAPCQGQFPDFFQDIQENASEHEILAPYVAMANPIAGVR